MKVLIALFLLISFSLNAYLIFQMKNRPSQVNSVMPEIISFPYLSKRIFAEQQNDIVINFIPLRSAMKNYIDKVGNAVSVYFEYLPSGTSIGINEKDEVQLASLIKVPIVMAAYKQVEKGTLSLDQNITVAEHNIDTQFGDLWKRGPGTQISLEEAIRLSLVDSDNTATRALVSVLPEGSIDEVFDVLDIPKDKNGTFPIISAKNYSSILRGLYLSAYLSKESSNTILLILSQTKFKDKLPAGVPEYIPVSHKIGVFDQPSTSSGHVFSDCGIVYVPKRPYILCIIAKTTNDQAVEYMSQLSKMVYGYVTSVNIIQ